jgi:hypothetical protein
MTMVIYALRLCVSVHSQASCSTRINLMWYHQTRNLHSSNIAWITVILTRFNWGTCLNNNNSLPKMDNVRAFPYHQICGWEKGKYMAAHFKSVHKTEKTSICALLSIKNQLTSQFFLYEVVKVSSKAPILKTKLK